MKRFAYSFILLSGLLVTFTQCKSTDAGVKTADKFFSLIVKGKFEKAAKMVELPIGDTTDLTANLKVMANNPVHGQLLSFNKSFGFSTNINNGITRVELPYVLTYEKGTESFTVVIVDRGSGNRIVSVN